jgi:hypothetical protein
LKFRSVTDKLMRWERSHIDSPPLNHSESGGSSMRMRSTAGSATGRRGFIALIIAALACSFV